jgi:hypothetical protein
MSIITGWGLPVGGSGFTPSGTDGVILTSGGLSQHPAVPALAFNSDTAVNSAAGASNALIASVIIPAGLLSPLSASPGLGGNLRRIQIRAYVQGANNANAKTAGIAFGAVTGIVARVQLTASVVATGVMEADITVDTNTTQTGLGYGLSATAAVGGAVLADVSSPVALTVNLSLAQTIFFTAVTQTSAADIILNGFHVVVF